jgi:hypothetical protein
MNEYVWSNGGMVLTRDNTSTWRETCWSATRSTTNLTWTDLGNPGLRRDRPVTNHLSHGKVFGIGQKQYTLNQSLAPHLRPTFEQHNLKIHPTAILVGLITAT